MQPLFCESWTAIAHTGGIGLQDLLSAYYDISTEDILVLDNRQGNKSGNYVYFIISASNREAIHMEQTTLAYYLDENNYDNIAIPVPTAQGNWLVTHEGKHHLVLQVNEQRERSNVSSPGQQLAEFHTVGSKYQYEPTAISSYGQWKSLWSEKLTMCERYLQAQDYPCSYYRLVMDTLPYLIGISENAIQYVQETEQEDRFDKVDQGTIAFNRYQDQIRQSVIWMDDLVYDHPVRDLAEYIRFAFLQEEDRLKDISQFVQEYQTVRPLSVFSWRLLYARLIFPVHLFDVLERGLLQKTEYAALYQEFADLLTKQNRYEQRLGNFFENMAFDYHERQVPVLHWL